MYASVKAVINFILRLLYIQNDPFHVKLFVWIFTMKSMEFISMC